MNGGLCERAADLARPLELQPVSGTFEDLQPVRTVDLAGGCLDRSPSERGVLIPPKESGRPRALQILRTGRPPPASGAKVGAVIVEGGGQPPWAAERTGEVFDHAERHRVGIRSGKLPRSPRNR